MQAKVKTKIKREGKVKDTVYLKAAGAIEKLT